MSNSKGNSGNRGEIGNLMNLSQFPQSARHTMRDDLQRIRLQLEALGLSEAEGDVRRAIVSVSAALDVPTHLSVKQIKDLS